MPTPLRTDLCSATRPPLKGYSSGMSQPPKFTIFAQRRRCNAFSGVFRMIAFAGEITESIPFARANLDGSMRPGCRQNKAFPAVLQWALRFKRRESFGFCGCEEEMAIPAGGSPMAFFPALAGGATLR